MRAFDKALAFIRRVAGSPITTLLHVAQNEEFKGDRGKKEGDRKLLLYMARKMAGTKSRRTEASN